MTINNYFHICGKQLTIIIRGLITFVERGDTSIVCLVDNICVLVLVDRSVFHPRVMLSDKRGFPRPIPKQMDIGNFTVFTPSGVNFPFTKTDCPVKGIYFSVC